MLRDVVDLNQVFVALANEHRRAVVLRLAVQPSSISGLASEMDMSLPAIHKHIRVLEEAGLLLRRKVGRTTFLALERAPLVTLQSWVEQFHPWWGTSQESLDNYLEHLQKDDSKSKGLQ